MLLRPAKHCNGALKKHVTPEFTSPPGLDSGCCSPSPLLGFRKTYSIWIHIPLPPSEPEFGELLDEEFELEEPPAGGLLDEEEFELEGPSGGLLDGAFGLLEAGFELFCGVLDPGMDSSPTKCQFLFFSFPRWIYLSVIPLLFFSYQQPFLLLLEHFLQSYNFFLLVGR